MITSLVTLGQKEINMTYFQTLYTEIPSKKINIQNFDDTYKPKKDRPRCRWLSHAVYIHTLKHRKLLMKRA